MCLPIYLLVDFQYFKVKKKNNHFCFCSHLVIEPLVCCPKSSEFYPDLYNSFSMASFCREIPKIRVHC